MECKYPLLHLYVWEILYPISQLESESLIKMLSGLRSKWHRFCLFKWHTTFNTSSSQDNARLRPFFFSMQHGGLDEICRRGSILYYKDRPKSRLVRAIRDRSTNMRTQGKSTFGGSFSPKKELWLVDWLGHSCKLDGWVRFNGFLLTQQCTTNIASIAGTVYIFSRNYNLKQNKIIIIFYHLIFFTSQFFSKTRIFDSFQALRLERTWR